MFLVLVFTYVVGFKIASFADESTESLGFFDKIHKEVIDDARKSGNSFLMTVSYGFKAFGIIIGVTILLSFVLVLLSSILTTIMTYLTYILSVVLFIGLGVLNIIIIAAKGNFFERENNDVFEKYE